MITINYLVINDTQIGAIEGDSYDWAEYTLKNIHISPNDIVKLQMEWGWFDVDYIKIEPVNN